MALGVFLQVTPLYTIAIGIFNARIIANQQSTERANELMFAMGSLIGGVGTIIGILGLVVLVVRLLFFR